jgi:hypothetical protein
MQPGDRTDDVDETLEPEADEIDEVVASLRQLEARVSSPMVRACLEDARRDILHLTGRDTGERQDEVEAA